jgi:polysaccharide export outer membrane protein
MLSCVSSEKINYFQDKDDNQAVNELIVNYEPTLQIGDMLTINVSALDQEAAVPFNLFESQTATNQTPLSYIINADGEINFPVLGKIKVAQLNTSQLTDYLTTSLNPYLKNPIVNVRIINFKVTVLGEVRNPGSYSVLNERISIIEALGLAGDLTIYGNRQNITLVREQNGKRVFQNIDITNKKLFDSPYFYLAQNDALYVSSNKTKVNSSGVGPNTSVIISAISILITLVAILVR